MKKYIYSLFMMILAVGSMISCSEEEGTNPGNDSRPNVVVYQFAPEAPYNADNDLLLRIAANSKVAEAYYLAEATTDKEAHIASMGKDGYMDYVIKNGTKIEGLSGASDSDVTVTGMVGEYIITVVAVNGNDKMATETTFTGLKWESIGIGMLSSSFFGGEGECEFYKASPVLKYKAIGPFEEGYDIVFDVADNNSVTVAQQAVYSSYGSYGTLYVSGNGALQSNKITVNLTFRVSAGVFGAFTETFILPVTEP